MQSLNRTFSASVLAVAGLAAAAGAQAQGSTSGSSSSWYAPGSTYIGLNAGPANYSISSGAGAFHSDKRHRSYSLYGGGYFNNNLGLELGYSDFGKVIRAGGNTEASGLNLSLVGRWPLNPSFNLLGKLGTTYGRTKVSAAAASGIASGNESGFGVSYGLGAEYAFDPNWSAVLQWDKYDLRFAANGRDRITTTTLGLRYRF